ncbi:response regulator transcription factor [Pleionea mediterranea]|jgi:two-component system response regulator PhoP|uniref:Two-component system response regulator PhoP n=1 Tax=Pleionea mediterranea TaxID=523701 RepID=A0A316FLS8_9GAMM|nr:response regulator transcription factor [Pleionea mediterranea]PWK49848.1 two-component system response regulator PhoP [Pleionea mediterranea]
MKILVVEDEQVLQEHLKTALNKQGYAVDQAFDGEDGLYYATEYPLDMAIIDLGLPKLNGLDLISKIREQGKEFPILILTARSRWQEKVEGLSRGADDYLVKPFQIEELLARVSALLRRSSGFASPVISKGPIELNSNSGQISLNGDELDLTAYEYKVLEYLLMNQDKVVSKTELTEHIYEQDHDKDSNVLEVFIRRLRKKLDPNGDLKPIETLRGRGYRLNPEL